MIDIDDQALLERLHKADYAAKLQNSEEWKLFNEAARRVAESAKDELAKVDPDDKGKIIKLQLKVSVYCNIVSWIIKQLQDGETAFEEAKARELVNRQGIG